MEVEEDDCNEVRLRLFNENNPVLCLNSSNAVGVPGVRVAASEVAFDDDEVRTGDVVV